MTTQLVPVFLGSISSESTLLCNARDLHAFLSVGKRFASWITERLAEYGFIENQDYILISQNWETKGRGGDRRSKDYHLTLDTAKELAMVERNEKGRQIRRYFIECEKQLHQQAHPATPAPTSYDARELHYKRAGVTLHTLPLKSDDIVLSVDSWREILRRNGWIVLRREDLVSRLSGMIEQCLV